MFNLDKYRDRAAIITDSNESIEYHQLKFESDKIAEQIEENNFVFCLCSNSIGSVIGYVGCLNNHRPLLLLDSEISKDSFFEIFNTYKPGYIWSPRNYLIECFSEIIIESRDYFLYKVKREKAPNEKQINPLLALCLTTSGSTGSPKLVRLSQENLLSNAYSIAEYLHISSDERPITSLPMHYSFGMSVINSHLIKGATLLMTNKSIMQKEFWNFMKEGHATSFSGVPYTYEMLLRLRFFRMNLPDLKVMTQAGGKLNEKLVKEFAGYALENDKDFFVMYGQTEASPRISYMSTKDSYEHPTSIGKAIPGGFMSLLNAAGEKIDAPNEEGELIYEGKNVCLGYANNIADLSKGDENHGILHTGDIAFKDSEGFFYITGRIKRFIKVWGNRCSLDTIEQVVREMNIESGVIGKDNLLIVVTTAHNLEEQIIEKLTERTGFHPSAFKIIVKESLPYSTSGKILYSQLEKELL